MVAQADIHLLPDQEAFEWEFEDWAAIYAVITSTKRPFEYKVEIEIECPIGQDYTHWVYYTDWEEVLSGKWNFYIYELVTRLSEGTMEGEDPWR